MAKEKTQRKRMRVMYDPNYGTDITELVQAELKKVPTSEIIGEGSGSLFRIWFSYETRRHQKRKQQKYVFAACKWWEGEDGLQIAKKKFFEWVYIFNIENPYRKIAKVRILRIFPYAYEENREKGRKEDVA